MALTPRLIHRPLLARAPASPASAQDVFRPPLIDASDLTRVHSDDYVNFLRAVTPDNMHEHLRQLQRFNVGEDCPVFDGLFEFCQVSASGSIGGAARLNSGDTDIAINWAGGLHHAKKCALGRPPPPSPPLRCA